MLGFSLKVVQFSADCQKNGLCYQGTVSKTISGKTCRQWALVGDNYPNNFGKLSADYCRNPNSNPQGRVKTFSVLQSKIYQKVFGAG